MSKRNILKFVNKNSSLKYNALKFKKRKLAIFFYSPFSLAFRLFFQPFYMFFSWIRYPSVGAVIYYIYYKSEQLFIETYTPENWTIFVVFVLPLFNIWFGLYYYPYLISRNPNIHYF